MSQSQSQSQCARASANASVPEPEPEPENVDREEMIEDENEDSMSAMREHTMNLTDDQVQVCARTLMDARERKEGEGGEGIT